MKSPEDKDSVYLSDRLYRRLQEAGFQKQTLGKIAVFSNTGNILYEQTIEEFEKFLSERKNNLCGRCVDLSYEAIKIGLANTIFAGCRYLCSDVTPGGVHYIPALIVNNGTGVAVDVTSNPQYFTGIGDSEIQGVCFVGTEGEIVQMINVGLQGKFSRLDPK